MKPALDETHEPSLESWVDAANGHPEFPIQNLPLGVLSPGEAERPRGGAAIGDRILDLSRAAQSGLLTGEAQTAATLASDAELNACMALPSAARRALRRQLSALLASNSTARDTVAAWLWPAASCRMHLPARIGDYT